MRIAPFLTVSVPYFDRKSNPDGFIWIRPPRYRGDSQNARDECSWVNQFRWVQFPGYQRVWSWDELSPKWLQCAKRMGHTQETWDNGYYRAWGIDPAQIWIGDRFGRLVIRRIIDDKCTVECDCGKFVTKIIGNLLLGNTLSCGVSCPLWIGRKAYEDAEAA